MTGPDQPLVVIVDDNANDYLLVTEAWREAGHDARFEHFPTAQPFLARVGLLPIPDLVVLDLNLPTMNGKEILALVRMVPQLQRVPIVVCSSSSDPKDETEVKRLGATGFFQKPATFDAFIPFTSALNDLLTYNREARRDGIAVPAIAS